MADLAVETAPQDTHALAKTAQEAAEAVAKGNQGAQDKRRSLVEAARAKLKAIIAAPAAVAAPAAAQATSEATPAPEAAPAAAQTAGVPAETLIKSFQDQIMVAAQAKQAAEQAAAAAIAEATRLKELAKNPLAFLNDQKISVDQWQARLLTGGAPTAEEQLTQHVNTRLQEFNNRLAQAEQDAAKRVIAAQLPPLLASEFPVVNARLGVDGAVAAAQEVTRRTGKQVDVKDFFAHLERTFTAEAEATAKALGKTFSAPATPPKNTAPKPTEPTTLTNKVTSSVGGTQKQGPQTAADLKAAGRNLLKQLAQAGRL